ncbi:MAG: efflux RND transporter periplasmic adaptor subunit [Chitinophagaceae bacterium]
MKQILKFSLFIFFAAGIISCNSGANGKNSQLAEKKQALQKKKDEVSKLNGEITKLESEVALIDTSAAKTEKPKLVAVTQVAKESFTHYIDLQGRVDAENISYVTPRGQGGQVRQILVKEGDAVRKGQLLMRLDNALLNENLETARTQLAFAQNIYQRQKNLWDQNIGTEVQLVTAKNNVDQAQRGISTLEEQLKFSNVYAEVSGIADEVNIRVGETFTGMPTSGIKIVNTSSLKVVTDIPENYITRVKKGTPVVITIPDLTKTFNSTISLISQSIGTSSRGFTAESKLPSAANLKPNQIALIKIQDYTAPNALSIPINTIQTDEKGKFVLVASNENGKMVSRKRAIVLGELYGDKIEITSGLQEGDVLITQGFQGLYEGQLITTSTI